MNLPWYKVLSEEVVQSAERRAKVLEIVCELI